LQAVPIYSDAALCLEGAIAGQGRSISARVGLTAGLHTWGSALTHHPHLHVIVPGGGLSPDGGRWIACQPGFFLKIPAPARRPGSPNHRADERSKSFPNP
jgi:Putative transposase